MGLCYDVDTFSNFMKILRKKLDRLATVRDLQDFVTKKYLDERLKNVATKRDLQNFITKEYLDECLKNVVTKDYLTGYIDIRFAELDERFVSRAEFREAMDRIYTSLDRIFALLENKEWEMTKHVVSRHEETLLNHGKRLGKLEATFKI